jgi:hypothetical protein
MEREAMIFYLLRVFVYRVLRRIFGLKKNEVTRKLVKTA